MQLEAGSAVCQLLMGIKELSQGPVVIISQQTVFDHELNGFQDFLIHELCQRQVVGLRPGMRQL